MASGGACVRTRRRTSGLREARRFQLPDRLAIIASAVVNADDASASGASILRPLCGKESLHAIFLDLTQVLDHAHLVLGSVSLVKMPQPVAGKTVTSRTVLFSTFLHCLAVLDLASDNRNGFVGICRPATGASVLFSQERHAYSAVHSTRSNQSLFHIVVLRRRVTSSSVADAARSWRIPHAPPSPASGRSPACRTRASCGSPASAGSNLG